MSEPDYGTEIKWDPVLGLLPGRTVSGIAVVEQAQAIRLLTRRGSCPGANGHGIDLRDYLHREMTAAELARIPGVVRAELLKDDRVRSVEPRLVPHGTTYDLEVRGVTKRGESFALVVPVSSLTVAEVDQ
jgi:hypothetical protein